MVRKGNKEVRKQKGRKHREGRKGGREGGKE